jgi:quercetin dioxygenase-like cupin family protein
VGPVRDAAPHSHGTVEHVLVTAGRLRVGPTDALCELETGDLATFSGDVRHRYEPCEDGTRAVLLIEYP